jgi:hypothetical protein
MEAEDPRLSFEPGPDGAMDIDPRHVTLSLPATPVSATHQSPYFHHSNSSLASVTGVSYRISNSKTPPGRLSLHHYRKILSKEDSTEPPDELKGRSLKRKAATQNLNPAKSSQDYFYFSSVSSPTSSAPSSPPPLSFSQSLQSFSTYPIGQDFEQPPSSVSFNPSIRLSPVSLNASGDHRPDRVSRTTTSSRTDTYRLVRKHPYRQPYAFCFLVA